MKLQEISYALRVAGDVARAGERLFESLAASRRLTAWPVMLAFGAGIGVGALIFNEDARKRAKMWFGEHEVIRVQKKPDVAPRPQTPMPFVKKEASS